MARSARAEPRAETRDDRDVRGADRADRTDQADPDGTIRGERLEPIRTVTRELTRPDGTTVVVEVPVYPPFRLAEGPARKPPPRPRAAPSLKGRRRAKPAS